MVTKLYRPALLPAYLEGDEAPYDVYDDEDDFVYGFRYVPYGSTDGDEMGRIPLTLDDVLHPQLDDVVNQSGYHFLLCERLTNILATYLAHTPEMTVLQDVLIQLRPRKRKTFAPDSIVVRDMHTFPQDTGYRPWQHGGHPVLIIEVTSNSTRHQDVFSAKPKRNKYNHYQRLGVPYYVIIDAAARSHDEAPALWGYVLRRRVYVPMAPDEHGRLWIAPIQASLGPYSTVVTWFDANGRRLPTHTEQQELTRQERIRAEHAEARAEHAEARAEEERARVQALEEELRQLKARLGLTD